MRLLPFFPLILAFTLALTPIAGHAAQDAKIASDQGAIRERPELDAKIIESAPLGTKLRVSSKSKDGWFKTKSSMGYYGWIWQGDLLLESSAVALRAADLSMRPNTHEARFSRDEPRYFLRVGGVFLGMFAPQFSARLERGGETLYLGHGFFIEAAYALKPRLRVSLRYHSYSNESDITGLGVPYQILHQGRAVLAGLEAEVVRSANSEVYGHVRVGFTPGNSVTVSVPAAPAPAPNSFAYTGGLWPALMVDASWRYLFTSWLSIWLDLGAYYSEIPTFRVPNGFNGDDAFRVSTTELTEVRISHAGPMASLGLMFSF